MKMPEVDISGLLPAHPSEQPLTQGGMQKEPAEENPVPSLRQALQATDRATRYHAIQKLAALAETAPPYPSGTYEAICDIWHLANNKDADPFMKGNARWAAGQFRYPTEEECLLEQE